MIIPTLIVTMSVTLVFYSYVLFSCACGALYAVFFFQAEDGIRDIGVTGVQTCALPIFAHAARLSHHADGEPGLGRAGAGGGHRGRRVRRSEERRVGKECRSRWSPY